MKCKISESEEQREAFYERLQKETKRRAMRKDQEESLYKHSLTREDLYGRHIGLLNQLDLDYLKKRNFTNAQVWLKQCDFGLFRIRLAELNMSSEDVNCFTAAGYYPTSATVVLTPCTKASKLLKELGFTDFSTLFTPNGRGTKKTIVATDLYSFHQQTFESVAEAARQLKLNRSTLASNVKAGRQYGGYSFEVIES